MELRLLCTIVLLHPIFHHSQNLFWVQIIIIDEISQRLKEDGLGEALIFVGNWKELMDEVYYGSVAVKETLQHA